MSLVPNSSLYYGSAERFDRIDVSKERGFQDFGKGFYMSVDRRQTIGMMHKKFEEAMGRRLNGFSVGLEKVLYRIDIDEAVLGELKIKTFSSADLEWVDFILRCRQVNGTLHDYDLVIGPTADDDTRLLMKNYVDGVYGDPDDPAAKNTLLRLLKPERLGVQWFVSKQSVVDRLVRDLVVVDWKECI